MNPNPTEEEALRKSMAESVTQAALSELAEDRTIHLRNLIQALTNLLEHPGSDEIHALAGPLNNAFHALPRDHALLVATRNYLRNFVHEGLGFAGAFARTERSIGYIDFIRSFLWNLNSTQVYFGRTPKWRPTRNGGIVLELQQPEQLFIMDQAMKIALINHLRERFDDIPGIESLQTTTQALEILQSAPDYLQVKEIAIMCFKFIEIHPSPVPEFAWDAYQSASSEAMKEVIISAVDVFSSLSLDEQEALTGSFFVSNAEGDGRVMTVSELVTLKSAPTVYFHFGNLVIKLKLEFRDDSGSIVSTTQRYVVDTGATHTTFPGYTAEGGGLWMYTANGGVVNVALLSHRITRGTVEGVGGTFPAKLLIIPFTLTSEDGSLALRLGIMLADVYTDSAPPEAPQTLVVGLDFLLQTTGCWCEAAGGGNVLNLEARAAIDEQKGESATNTMMNTISTVANTMTNAASAFSSAFGGGKKK
eukprot:gene30424-36760_t